MLNRRKPNCDLSRPMVYQIRIKGQLGQKWTEWFDGMTITLDDNGNTLFTGLVVDQAALHGMLRKIRNLGMPLLSVAPVLLEGEDQPDGKNTP